MADEGFGKRAYIWTEQSYPYLCRLQQRLECRVFRYQVLVVATLSWHRSPYKEASLAAAAVAVAFWVQMKRI